MRHRLRLPDRLFALIGRAFRRDDTPPPAPTRGARDLVIVLDGTLSKLDPGWETNAGQAYKLLRGQQGRQVAVYYEAGLQWQGWRDTLRVMTGQGIDAQIQRAYGWLASHYRPGDRIYLIGYSRGAYAVRSLAGIIGRIGLLRHEHTTERNLRHVYRLYCRPDRWQATQAFHDAKCHDSVQIEAIGVWDTVKALGMRLPVLWMIADRLHGFHDHTLGHHVRAGYHALALHERRTAYAPVMWKSRPLWQGQLEQVWFKGTHGDVGGQLGGRVASRPLANVPLVWLLQHMQSKGLPLPDGWPDRFPQNANAPSIGGWAGWSKVFLARGKRKVGDDPSEALHPSVPPDG